jgi:ketosteroid isomerase-like protein
MSDQFGLPPTLVRLVTATNNHDLEGLVACFADDYSLEVPNHPTRNFTGPDWVRRNWSQFFTAIPDISVTLTDAAAGSGDKWWTEWEMRGTRLDGSHHLVRGVMVMTVGPQEGDLVRSNRFYLEPTDSEGEGVDNDAAVARLVGPGAST